MQPNTNFNHTYPTYPQVIETMPASNYVPGSNYATSSNYVPVSNYATSSNYVPGSNYVPAIQGIEYNNLSNPNIKTERLAKFDSLIRKYEINPEYAIKLRQLEGFEIVIICDDSGSMNTPVSNPTTKDHMNLSSRWDELKSTVKTIVEIAGTLDRTGVDVYFLNRPGIKNVTEFIMLEPYFATEPEGYTPIVQVATQVLNDMRPILSEKKLLIILATDGEPTTGTGMTISHGITEKQKFYNLLKTREPIDKIFVSILACTDDSSAISYLQDWDQEIQNLDVVDDFNTVKSNVLQKQGQYYHFTFGDYIVKTLLGSMDKYFDEIDEVKDNNFSKGTNCTIL
jgi:hypothetical protein